METFLLLVGLPYLPGHFQGAKGISLPEIRLC